MLYKSTNVLISLGVISLIAVVLTLFLSFVFQSRNTAPSAVLVNFDIGDVVPLDVSVVSVSGPASVFSEADGRGNRRKAYKLRSHAGVNYTTPVLVQKIQSQLEQWLAAGKVSAMSSTNRELEDGLYKMNIEYEKDGMLGTIDIGVYENNNSNEWELKLNWEERIR